MTALVGEQKVLSGKPSFGRGLSAPPSLGRNLAWKFVALGGTVTQ